MMANSFEMIAKTFQGLEEVLAKELIELGADQVEIIKRGVRFYGDQEMMYKANFRCRTALRILKPFYKFDANDAEAVYNKVKKFDWTQYLDPQKTFAIDAVVFSENFKHSKFLAYRVKDAIADFFMEKYSERPSVRINNPDIQLNIHVAGETCTLSLDSSGESLHQRGYKTAQTEAPINEVLAAGMLKLAGWDGQCDFMDPMCGSGTIAIEAALMALNIAPGLYRSEFAFEKWPDFNQELLDELYNDESQERAFDHKIYASDISTAALRVAEENVKNAGLTKHIILSHKPFQACERPANETMVMFNPPYGERLKNSDLGKLYEEIGSKLKQDFTDMTAWIITVDTEATGLIGLRPSEKFPLLNGAIECEFCKYEMFKGRRNDYLRERYGERDDRRSEEQKEDRRPDRASGYEGVFLRKEEDHWHRSSFSENEQSEYDRRRHEAFEEHQQFLERKKAREERGEERDGRREFRTRRDGDFNRKPFDRGERRPFRGDRNEDGDRPFRRGERREDEGRRPFRKERREGEEGRPFRREGRGGFKADRRDDRDFKGKGGFRRDDRSSDRRDDKGGFKRGGFGKRRRDDEK